MDKGSSKDVESRKISEEKGTSEAETVFICEQQSINLASEECTWVIDSDASFHITPWRDYFSAYIVGDHGYVKMGDNG